ncbi:MAG: CotH kinase family protein [Clostridia bacterium]|nr:CotH kinase family protein [Clostridia bacterium]
MKRIGLIIAICLFFCFCAMPALTEDQALPVIRVSFPKDARLSVTESVDAQVSIDGEGAFDAKLWLSGGHMDVAEIALPQKSLRIEGENTGFVLYNGGTDGLYTRVISQVCCDLIDACSLPIAVRMQAPVEVYLNGEYAGLYTRRERIQDAVARFEGLTGDANVNVADASGAALWGKDGFKTVLKQLLTVDFSDAEAFERTQTLFDTESFLNCLAVNTYFGNSNFYGSFFFYQVGDGPWKCAVGDLAFAFFSARDDSMNRILSLKGRGDLLSLTEKLLSAPTLREAFLEKLGTIYQALPTQVMQAAVDAENARIAAALPSHMRRWAAKFSVTLKNDFDYPAETAEDALKFQRYRIYRLRDKTMVQRPWYLYDSVQRALQVSDEDMLRFFGSQKGELPEVPGDGWPEYQASHP